MLSSNYRCGKCNFRHGVGSLSAAAAVVALLSSRDRSLEAGPEWQSLVDGGMRQDRENLQRGDSISVTPLLVPRRVVWTCLDSVSARSASLMSAGKDPNATPETHPLNWKAGIP